ncbi:ferredoxin [Actinomadura rupiterrae]|uniref:ferredoxin n=1 Tax=Actinomadura rupiterrae TaxID=559627 RepID=UPI0020A2B33D|nr:ferredoxin [Actinomadura rupiterrae]MCP2339297.1 ferredoxin [Actinomadura rupiterrae]
MTHVNGGGDRRDDAEWRVEVDASTCIGSGMCESLAPAAFRLAGARSRPTRDRTRPDRDVLDAAEACPVEAILVRGAATGEILAPDIERRRR